MLAAGKAASSLAALGFYLFDDDVFVYLLNFLVDGFLVGVALLLWSLAGRVGDPAGALLKARAGAAAPPSCGPCALRRGDGARRRAAAAGAPGLSPHRGSVDRSPSSSRYLAVLPGRARARRSARLRAFEWLPFPWRFSRASLERAPGLPRAAGGLAARR